MHHISYKKLKKILVVGDVLEKVNKGICYR